MRTAIVAPMRRTTACVILVLAARVTGQDWHLAGTSTPLSFGLTNELLVHDGTGWVGYDEQGAQTLLGIGSGFAVTPAPIPTCLLATLVARNGSVFLFGGVATNGQATTSLWTFRRAAGWSALTAVGQGAPGPSARSGCRAAPFGSGQQPVFFGGQDATGALPTDTWLMIPTTTAAIWSPVLTPNVPPGRTRHALAAGPSGTVVLFGGTDGTPLGDTWILRNPGWTQFTGIGPPATADARMVYDSARAISVLVHPNGETWEWDDYRWRRVGATGTPTWNLPAVGYAPGTGTTAFQPSGNQLDRHEFTPSPARFLPPFEAGCAALGGIDMTLDPVERSAPVLGQTLHLRATQVPPGSLFIGVYEFPQNTTADIGCNCTLAVSGVQAGLQFVPGNTTVRDWLLPIAAMPALYGVSIAGQGIAVSGTQPCLLMTTTLVTFVLGW